MFRVSHGEWLTSFGRGNYTSKKDGLYLRLNKLISPEAPNAIAGQFATGATATAARYRG